MCLKMLKLAIMLAGIMLISPLLKYQPEIVKNPVPSETETEEQTENLPAAESLTETAVPADKVPVSPIIDKRVLSDKTVGAESDPVTEAGIVTSETAATITEKTEIIEEERTLSVVEEAQVEILELSSESETAASVAETSSANDVPNETDRTEAPTVHLHTWVPVTEVIHHDAVYQTVHHDARTEKVWITDQPAYDEYRENTYVIGVHDICKGCGLDITAAGMSYEEYEEHDRQHVLSCEESGFYSEAIYETRVETIHHEAEGHYEDQVVQEAYDEPVLVSEARDEEIVSGYRCNECGAMK